MNCVKKTVLIFAIAVALNLCATVSRAESVVYNSNIHAGKKIALTFDDGPHPRLTQKVLDILDKYSIKATFFVIGVNVKNYPKQLEMIIDKGHEIGNHTYSHNLLKSIPKEKIEKEISDTEKEIKNIRDYDLKLLRPPCGFYDEKLEKIAMDKGSKIVLWSIDTLDWSHASAKNMSRKILKNAKDGDIILFHDYVSGEYNTPETLEIIIPILLEKGYEFVTVSELLQ